MLHIRFISAIIGCAEKVGPLHLQTVKVVKSQFVLGGINRGRMLDAKGKECQEGNIPLLHLFLNLLQIAVRDTGSGLLARAQTVAYQFPDNKISSWS